ncbi:MAG: YceI family protein [Ignavibacteria bacterium]
MKSLKSLLFVFLIATTSVFARQADWNIDVAHSKVQFSVSHMLISEVIGYFKKFDARINAADDELQNANIEFTIDVSSINTDNEARDNHLKSDDFFNAEKFPKITFKGKSLKKVGEGRYKLTGDFTMRDITKQIELDVVHGGTIKDPYGKIRSGYKISGTVNRLDYNLKWNKLMETGGAMVGREVSILCNIEIVKEK